ncbi:MAG: hypothetical protein JNL83_09150 [Myxococcales bacterium]|nr:hypothetical protein [Myxococcales bacterium]
MLRIVVLVVALGACGKGDKTDKADKGPSSGATNADGDELPRAGACDTRAKNNLCVEYFGQPGTAPGISENSKTNCVAAEGTVVDKCPTEGAFGRCISNEIRIQQMLVYAPMTKEKAEMYCKGMGDGKLGPL